MCCSRLTVCVCLICNASPAGKLTRVQNGSFRLSFADLNPSLFIFSLQIMHSRFGPTGCVERERRLGANGSTVIGVGAGVCDAWAVTEMHTVSVLCNNLI